MIIGDDSDEGLEVFTRHHRPNTSTQQGRKGLVCTGGRSGGRVLRVEFRDCQKVCGSRAEMPFQVERHTEDVVEERRGRGRGGGD